MALDPIGYRRFGGAWREFEGGGSTMRGAGPASGDPEGDEDEMMGTRATEELAAPLGAVEMGHLVFARGASHLTIRVDGAMDDLYRARFQGKIPEVQAEAGTVTVKYRPGLHPPRGEITLNGRIPWSIHARFGLSNIVAELEHLELRGWEVSAGASQVEATLPRPANTVGIRIGGGASHVELIRPAGVPVRVRVGGGASHLSIDDFRGSGKVDWRSPDYDRLEGRYDIEIGAGASRVTVRS